MEKMRLKNEVLYFGIDDAVQTHTPTTTWQNTHILWDWFGFACCEHKRQKLSTTFNHVNNNKILNACNIARSYCSPKLFSKLQWQRAKTMLIAERVKSKRQIDSVLFHVTQKSAKLYAEHSISYKFWWYVFLESIVILIFDTVFIARTHNSNCTNNVNDFGTLVYTISHMYTLITCYVYYDLCTLN